MPQSKKDLRKLHQKQKVAAGVAPTERKAPNTQAVCTACRAQFRTTKRNIEIYEHWEQRHGTTHTFDQCFPGETSERLGAAAQ
ncbi:hypothetical protein PAPYR_4991 [Paratrimastix pyriformis]|uniref:At2g23090-like zinc-binding domain-containing protein n=1 Tax=Paratrimastix pyriformis TaxID=342808 RepID=A0ABQ8UNU9_9EUKA|nr:hypothetical protein PAPYR_4991 [Paratrimastix pyriformis]|eukprot:EC834860.1.p3 GENE.EC834860.1~~EC834860.1.p3  ORF type:complete len:83 (+),score=20.77 EC834860.1:17-265(+)